MTFLGGRFFWSTLYSSAKYIFLGLICLKAVENLAVDELAVDEASVEKLAVDKFAVDKLAVDKFAVWYVSCRTFRIYDIKSGEL